MKMRTCIAIVLLASVVAGCTTPRVDEPARGLTAVNQPVVTRSEFAMDLSAPDGSLSSSEEARLDGWFRGLGLGYGDRIYIDGDYAGAARQDVARVAGRYGMMLSASAPITAGNVQPGTVRVVVSRARAQVPGCPNWDRPASPDFDNLQPPNFGCGVNSNMTAMVADPNDLVYGRDGGAVVDAATAAKAIQMYRDWPLTGVVPGQALRPLDEKTNAKKGDE